MPHSLTISRDDFTGIMKGWQCSCGKSGGREIRYQGGVHRALLADKMLEEMG